MTYPTPEFLNLQAALAGEYSLERELGRGGMGVVYLARDVQLDRDVAIKVLPPDLATLAMRQQFVREARTAAGLSHPHIVPIHRVGEAGGFVFFVMSYIAGETLGERLRTSGPLAPAEATRVLREVAWALAYAHRHGIVHRDVKPDNILLEAGTGRALVTDFGIAHGHHGANDAADAVKVKGTAHFMSPEQAAGVDVDGRSDIYALGVVGYLAVSGRLPFESKNLPQLLVSQASEMAPSVATAAPGLPPALSAAIDRCLARDPADRFSDAEKLADALVPATETRPALPATLRAWLGARNPLAIPYAAWSSVWGLVGVSNLIANLNGSSEAVPWDFIVPLTALSLPVFPIVGYHLNHAWRQFRAGHTLADLRAAIAVEQREWSEADALARREDEPLTHRLLRLATAGVASWAGVILFMLVAGIEGDMGPEHILPPFLGTLLLGAASNVLDVRFLPAKIKKFWQTGIRDRMWNSWVGESIAKLMGAPERSQLAGAAAFRATESALGVAASELFAALPTNYREHLAGLPPIVEALEARAAGARAEIDVVNALVPSGSAFDAELLADRKKAAAMQLGETVAALERIRLDLLRLHAGAADLAPLTTLMDAARSAGQDLRRLGEAQREVDDVAGRRLGVERLRTPA
jgi:serine/threonine-protein kinase